MYGVMDEIEIAKRAIHLSFPGLRMEAPLIRDVEEVGRGVFGKFPIMTGKVYRATDINRAQRIALKRVQKFSTKMSREVEILYALRNEPHCVQMLDFFFSFEDRAMIMNIAFEYIPMTLEDMLDEFTQKNKKFTLKQIKTIMKELLIGMDEIHSKGIIHRDIKPDNIFIREDLSVIKFGDFGASKYENKSIPCYPTRVSKSYRAPELMCGTSVHTTKLDIWSLGCVFLELFTLYPFFDRMKEDSQQFYHVLEQRGGFNQNLAKNYCRLFHEKSHADQLRDVLKRVPSSRKLTFQEMMKDRGLSPKVPRALQRVIEAMVEPDPFKRASARELLEMGVQEKLFDCVN